MNKPDEIPQEIWDKIPESDRATAVEFTNDPRMALIKYLGVLQSNSAEFNRMSKGGEFDISSSALGISAALSIMIGLYRPLLELMGILSEHIISDAMKASYVIGYNDGVRDGMARQSVN